MPPKSTTQTSERILTDVELELMNIIWSYRQATVKEVITHLPAERALAYTTVATVMKILVEKGFLTCQKNSFAHVFLPLISKEDYEATCIEHMVSHVFDGEPLALMQRLLSAQKLRTEDIKSIEKVLKNLVSAGEE